ncbi:hypothetical protein JCGZ_22708 [Jatropha curcas]|uniref:Uncharacterized protein n=1 Tax=Jatropha curcas TaxID=180498 RepID=A0A067JT33_JATCU|nr:hypothetical protein JCGZ_22708 [Jatropha curcas]
MDESVSSTRFIIKSLDQIALRTGDKNLKTPNLVSHICNALNGLHQGKYMEHSSAMPKGETKFFQALCKLQLHTYKDA